MFSSSSSVGAAWDNVSTVETLSGVDADVNPERAINTNASDNSSPEGNRKKPVALGSFPLDMWVTCRYVLNMPKMIQLRHVPDDLHRKLKARAALAGLSLSDYLLQEVRRTAERPTVAELRARLVRRTPVITRVPPAKAVRAERERR